MGCIGISSIYGLNPGAGFARLWYQIEVVGAHHEFGYL
jgi:hypothetical protein